MSLEQESKFSVHSVLPLVALLENQGQLRTAWHFEQNTLYDHQQELAQMDKLLRLRQAAGQTILTVKEPVLAPKNAGVKSRQEFECLVESWTQMDQILRALGYQPRLCYEKFRSTWLLEAMETAVICLDILPFGHFVEIEGSPSIIQTTAMTLGLNPEQALSASYHRLHQNWLQEQNLPVMDDILFLDQDKTELASLLGCTTSKEKIC